RSFQFRETNLFRTPSSGPDGYKQKHPFQCMDCGKSFKWSSRLAHHQRSHNNERPYRCNLCPKAFKGSSALLYHQSHVAQVHRSVHTGLRTFQCPYCTLTFKWSSHYQYHLRQHTGECPYPCDSCPKAFKNSSSLRRHKNVHLGLKPYVCTVCAKAFTQSTNLRQHMRIHTGERPYVCGECGRSFTHSSNLALHRNSHAHTGEGRGGRLGGGEGGEVFLSSGHQTFLPQLTLAPAPGSVCTSRAIGTEVHVSTESGASVLLYSCGSCSQTFGTRTELEDHQAMHLGPGGGGGGPGGGPGGEGGAHSLSPSHSRTQFSCSACDRSFTLLSSLLTHQHSHTPEQRLLAEAEAEIVCPPSLSLSLSLPSSPSQRPYRCSECGKAFKGSSGLRYHMRDHTGERPYRCTECGKSFKRSSLLSIHQRVHTGVRAFQCPYCPLTFKWSSHYQYHLRQHTGERPYVCQECGKSFKNTSCLRRHSQLHSGLRPHVCTICTKSFSQTSNLKQHERTHSGERPFQCAQCHKSFTHSSNLQLHLRTHSSRKDYKCPFCGKEFVMHSYLQRHMRTHGNGAVAGGAGAGIKEGGRGGKGGGAVTTTTLLNPITLETTGTSGSLIVSQPALDIPPNTSQNYFMIQTANGLQLIPLSTPAPPPPPPPPPPQTHLILVPTTSTNPRPAQESQGLPLIQTVLNPGQTQMPHFQTISQPQQQHRFIITNNNNLKHTPVATKATPSLTSMLTKPILGKSTRTARTRRGRKPKATAAPKTTADVSMTTTSVTVTTAPASQSEGVVAVSRCDVTGVAQPPVRADTITSSPSSSLPTKSPNVSSPSATSVPTPSSSSSSSATTVISGPTTVTTAPHPSDHVTWGVEPQTASEDIKTTEQAMRGEQYVLCFEKGGKKEELEIGGEGGGSYVLQFEGEASGEGGQGGMVAEGESYVLSFQAEGESEGESVKEKGGIVSLNLLQEWGGEREGERQAGEEGGDRESFVLHFQTEPQSEEGTTSGTAYPEGSNNSLGLSCPSSQAGMPLGEQEVVFELGDENKMVDRGSGESVQMIALIEREGGGEEEGERSSYSGARGEVGEGEGEEPMEGIFQLESGEGIVIIEVSTSNLREAEMNRGGEGGTVDRSEAKGGSGIMERPGKGRNSVEIIGETGANEGENTVTNGPAPNTQFLNSP
uniref:C2H2-type domain-containing protein n=1 Tax=Esox lucius TaxID=8010 RepID=A0A3P9A6S5_ESOLU